MALIQTIFFTLLALSILVAVHEYGHFWVARRCGIKVIRFSIGFGKPLCRWQDRYGTEFVIAALPLGGYVKMVDEREGDVSPEDLPHAFTQKTVWQRMAVVAAGPLANFLLAILAYWIIFSLGVTGYAPVLGEVKSGSIVAAAGLQAGDEIVAIDGHPTLSWQSVNEQLINRIGETGQIAFSVKREGSLPQAYHGQILQWLADAKDPNPISSLGITFYTPPIAPVIDRVIDNEPAALAGFKTGDKILSVDGETIQTWGDWVEYVRLRPDTSLDVVVDREGESMALPLTPKAFEDESGKTIGQVGMAVKLPVMPKELVRNIQYSLPGAFVEACGKTWDTTVMILASVKKMVMGLISAKHLSGPITIAKVAGTSAEYGVVPYLGFLAFLSISLGVMNLMPVPVLDGGHLLYYLVEAIKGSPVPDKVQMLGFKVGACLVVGLMVFALYNDLMRVIFP